MTSKNIHQDTSNEASNSPTQDPQNSKGASAPSYSLPEYITLASKAIHRGLPHLAWVEAMIFDMKPSKRGFTIELVDPAVKNSSESASLRGFIGKETQALFENTIGCKLTPSLLAGVKARLLIEPQFHQRFHLQAKIIEIDPAIGESLLSKRLNEIRSQLKREGLFNQQRQWKEPLDLTRLIVIRPPFSAGWEDIADTLKRFESSRILKVYSIEAFFEGASAVSSLRMALLEAHRLVWEEEIDLVLIVRGGGAAAGLAALANFELARLICTMPAPTLTGTGHAVDHSILDEVAWRAAHTPSLALQHVIKILRRCANDALRSYQFIVAETENRLERTFRPRLEYLRQDCQQSLGLTLARSQSLLDALRAELRGSLRSLPRELVLRQQQIAGIKTQMISGTRRLLLQAATTLDDKHRDLREHVVIAVQDHEKDLGVLYTEIEDAIYCVLDAHQTASAALRDSVKVEALRILADAENALELSRATIVTLSLDGTLSRGFVVALNDRNILKTRAAALACDTFEILFQDGFLRVGPR